MSQPPPPPPLPPQPPHESPQNIATAITDVSERAAVLAREEVELFKAEVYEKAASLARGAAVGLAAGVFLFFAVVFALVGCAWLLYYYLPGNDFTYFWGFFAMAIILAVIGIGVGGIAARAVRRSAPPTPDMAIEEARRIRETIANQPPPGGGDGTAPPVPAAPGKEG